MMFQMKPWSPVLLIVINITNEQGGTNENLAIQC